MVPCGRRASVGPQGQLRRRVIPDRVQQVRRVTESACLPELRRRGNREHDHNSNVQENQKRERGHQRPPDTEVTPSPGPWGEGTSDEGVDGVDIASAASCEQVE